MTGHFGVTTSQDFQSFFPSVLSHNETMAKNQHLVKNSILCMPTTPVTISQSRSTFSFGGKYVEISYRPNQTSMSGMSQWNYRCTFQIRDHHARFDTYAPLSSPSTTSPDVPLAPPTTLPAQKLGVMGPCWRVGKSFNHTETPDRGWRTGRGR